VAPLMVQYCVPMIRFLLLVLDASTSNICPTKLPCWSRRKMPYFARNYMVSRIQLVSFCDSPFMCAASRALVDAPSGDWLLS
jgi:hypothetical protein